MSAGQPPGRVYGGEGLKRQVLAVDPFPHLAYFSHMSVKSIIKLPDEKILRQKSVALKSVDEAARKLFDDMLETMYAAPGIGLSSIQVGVPLRQVVLDISREGEEKKPLF